MQLKFGDRVIKTQSTTSSPAGEKGTVASPNMNGYVDVDWDNRGTWLTNINWLQLISTVNITMAYKVGDKVRRIGKDVSGYVDIGDKGTIVDLEPNSDPAKNIVIVDWDNGSKAFRNLEKFVELLKSTRDFAVGDRVKRIIDRSRGAVPVGALGTIVKIINSASIKVNFDNEGTKDIDTYTIELVSSEAPNNQTATTDVAVSASNTIPSPSPQFQDNVFCKKKYYGISPCACGRCPQQAERYR